ncbi:SAF domain-containing protein [Micromonospora sp. WMMD1102]|uniref:SAF domain-containing protein n=1 Tax=Micromonospora sp. WMMD1102 TaxID=3016105 RepID=UPI0024156148|nr:SAF domain-containing protein [Micromonospora sp. WMMD1102]MDG4790182.1 SAF domain-containing protein [Micromonospora sp. WMMD1102]
MPFVALGGLLVIVCVLAYAYGAAQLGDRVQVLAVARPVTAGQPITAADLKQVSAAHDPGVRLVPASQAVKVVGRTAVVPLVAGTLLTPELLGDAAFPPGGQVTASLALKPGQYPQGLAAGARVSVYVSTTARDGGQSAPAASSAAAPARMSAVVLRVDLAGDGEGSTVVTLLLAASDAPQLAAAPSGGVVLMQTSPERD